MLYRLRYCSSHDSILNRNATVKPVTQRQVRREVFLREKFSVRSAGILRRYVWCESCICLNSITDHVRQMGLDHVLIVATLLRLFVPVGLWPLLPLWSSDQIFCLQTHRPRDPRFNFRPYQILWIVLNLEWGPISFVRVSVEVIERNIMAPV